MVDGGNDSIDEKVLGNFSDLLKAIPASMSDTYCEVGDGDDFRLSSNDVLCLELENFGF